MSQIRGPIQLNYNLYCKGGDKAAPRHSSKQACG